MGFPETFKIQVSDTQAYKQFGNSVVVPLVMDIAREIVNALDNNFKKIIESSDYKYSEVYNKCLSR
jgi:DNA (cytosine-5)-methyltransferase 1